MAQAHHSFPCPGGRLRSALPRIHATSAFRSQHSGSQLQVLKAAEHLRGAGGGRARTAGTICQPVLACGPNPLGESWSAGVIPPCFASGPGLQSLSRQHADWKPPSNPRLTALGPFSDFNFDGDWDGTCRTQRRNLPGPLEAELAAASHIPWTCQSAAERKPG